MNAAIAPYVIVLLMIRSMSYRLCFTIAMPIATQERQRDRDDQRGDASMKTPTLSARAATAAAETNHLSCRRSSPWIWRTTSEATDSSSATISASTAITMTVLATVLIDPAATSMPANGCDQPAVARISAPTESTRRMTITSQRTGRQRGDGRCPVGNRRNSRMRAASGIGHRTLLTHARTRPAGRDPGSARRAWSVDLAEASRARSLPRDDEDPADRVARTLVHDHDAEDRPEAHEHAEDVGGAPVARSFARSLRDRRT